MASRNGHDGISRYYNTINKYPLLTVDQEIDLALRIKEGDKEAKEKMIVSNLRLAANIARIYAVRREPSGRLDQEDFLDLAQEGTLGLMKAVDRFDLSFNCTFSTYAYYWVRRRITRAIENDVSVRKSYRISVNMHNEIRRLEKIIVAYEVSKGEKLDEEELAEITGKSVEVVKKILSERNRLAKISLNALVGEDGAEFSYLIPDCNEEERRQAHYREVDLNEVIENALSIISSEEKELLVGRFLKEKTLDELGKKFSLSRERIRQKEEPLLRSVGQYIILFYPEIAKEFIKSAN